jgi:hypothetical protein
MSPITKTIDGDAFDRASQRIQCAKAILTAFGVLMAESTEDGFGSVAGGVMNDAMMGVGLLLDDAMANLQGETGATA